MRLSCVPAGGLPVFQSELWTEPWEYQTLRTLALAVTHGSCGSDPTGNPKRSVSRNQVQKSQMLFSNQSCNLQFDSILKVQIQSHSNLILARHSMYRISTVPMSVFKLDGGKMFRCCSFTSQGIVSPKISQMNQLASNESMSQIA